MASMFNVKVDCTIKPLILKLIALLDMIFLSILSYHAGNVENLLCKMNWYAYNNIVPLSSRVKVEYFHPVCKFKTT